MNPTIAVENLGKKYRIRHEQKARYNTLRDELAGKAKLLGLALLGRRRRFVAEDFWALQHVSFQVGQGERLGIIGRNGAGKSTLLKLLSRITEPSAGRLQLRGRLASLLEVGTGFHPELTGQENIYLNGSILGMARSEIRSKLDEIVAFSEIGPFIDTPVKRYSSGMYVRLAFSVAAHLEPDILVIDEVLSVGDAGFQKKCMAKIEEVSNKEGRTVLFVSHNMAAIRRLCERCILLEEGQIVFEGEPKDVVSEYLGGTIERSDVRWDDNDRPRNEFVSVSRLRLCSPTGDPKSSIFLAEEAVVELEFEVHQDDTRVAFALAIDDEEERRLFVSFSTRDSQSPETQLSKGRHFARCLLPANLLNDMEYAVSVVVRVNPWSTSDRDRFSLERVLRFKALDDGVLKGDFTQSFSGAIRPDLSWEIR